MITIRLVYSSSPVSDRTVRGWIERILDTTFRAAEGTGTRNLFLCADNSTFAPFIKEATRRQRDGRRPLKSSPLTTDLSLDSPVEELVMASWTEAVLATREVKQRLVLLFGTFLSQVHLHIHIPLPVVPVSEVVPHSTLALLLQELASVLEKMRCSLMVFSCGFWPESTLHCCSAGVPDSILFPNFSEHGEADTLIFLACKFLQDEMSVDVCF